MAVLSMNSSELTGASLAATSRMMLRGPAMIDLISSRDQRPAAIHMINIWRNMNWPTSKADVASLSSLMSANASVIETEKARSR